MVKKDTSKDIVKQSNNNEKRKPVAGFNVHPENINRNGAPRKEQTLTYMARQIIEGDPEIKKAIIQKVFNMALGGDIAAMKLLWNYIDGMPKQSIEVDNGDDQKLDMLALLITKYESDAKQLLDGEDK